MKIIRRKNGTKILIQKGDPLLALKKTYFHIEPLSTKLTRLQDDTVFIFLGASQAVTKSEMCPRAPRLNALIFELFTLSPTGDVYLFYVDASNHSQEIAPLELLTSGLGWPKSLTHTIRENDDPEFSAFYVQDNSKPFFMIDDHTYERI